MDEGAQWLSNIKVDETIFFPALIRTEHTLKCSPSVEESFSCLMFSGNRLTPKCKKNVTALVYLKSKI